MLMLAITARQMAPQKVLQLVTLLGHLPLVTLCHVVVLKTLRGIRASSNIANIHSSLCYNQFKRLVAK